MTTNLLRYRRIRRGRRALHGTASRPRVAVQRTAKHFRAQAINDDTGRTIFAVADNRKTSTNTTDHGMARAERVGHAFAEAAKRAHVSTFVFDRRGYRYHGRVKRFVDAIREAGLKI